MPPHHERAAYLKSCAANFARDLETILQRDPLQWYNFFPFWENETSGSKPPEKSTTGILAPHASRLTPTKP